MTTSETECATEVVACNDDTECVDCFTSYAALVEGCLVSAGGTTCDDLEGAVCCAVDGCEDNDGLNDLLACINADTGCSFDLGDCASDGSRAISDSDATTDTDSAGYLTTSTTTSTTDTIYTSMTTSETECATEVVACNDDTECVDCVTSYAALVEGCLVSAGGTTCDDLEGAVCCAVDGCEDNDGLNDLLACINADTGCSFDFGDCASGGSRAISDSDATTDTDSAGYLTTSTTTSTTDTIYTSMTTSETECATEVEACNDDTECVDCFTSYAALVEGCLVSAGGTTCDDLEGAVCCAVDGCEDNDGLSDLLACINADTGCSFDLGDCASGGSGAISGSDTTTDTGSPTDTSTDTDSEIDATTDTDSTAADDGESTGSAPLPIGDDDEDKKDATDDADPTNTESSATRSAAAKGSSAVVWLIAAAAPSLWRRFQ
ncbi:hypothetical protein Esi_1409_0001 [Ectocarpus siliculosus]|uniref:Uncharacterized protein n=1 Tax=Ectocarpus siliculosus TaxID=2880 RepID=D7FK67_ECTSI|nr:hypothetical protein Esi_1409_0001 [Ectocarpus siliculosus]|eukprot:CBJ34199.1 hypothetical protein Esi_1409_0001 [Ectocarpus siliculosus]